ncbi:MAG: isoleucine--tRNA ligase, partial [Acidobacteria bacterium]|nr:isoleucine--tRNA ligase [Acidobacteriota bacterium]
RGVDESDAVPASVHLALFPQASGERDAEMAQRWEKLFAVRDDVLRKLEEARHAKLIGSSLEAHVSLTAGGETYELLERYRDELRFIYIVSQVSLSRSEESGVSVSIERASGEKCERCWNYSTRVGESMRYPTACERCVEALTEIEREEAA